MDGYELFGCQMSVIPNTEVKIETAPRIMNRVEVAILSHFIGSRETSFAPMRTATPVNTANAETIPTRTRIGEDCTANVMVIIWVLSPSSMRAMSEKLASKGRVLGGLFTRNLLLFSFRNSGMMPNTTKTMPETTCT